MTTKSRMYRTADGTLYPLTEAEYDMAFTVYKSDKRKSVIGDPLQCIEARGIKRDPNVLEAYVGSGKDAYVVFKARGRLGAGARHFTIPAKSAKVRDAFETKGSPKTQVLWLRAPSAGRTLD